MPFTPLQLKHRSEWQRDYLEKRYRSTGAAMPRQSAIDSARMHDYGITVRYEHWQPDDSERPAGVSDTYRTPPLW